MSNDATYRGKTILITGASRGIGKAISLAFAEREAHVGLISQSDGVFKAQQEVERLGGIAIGVRADISDKQQVAMAVKQVLGAYDTIDVLVNCAAIIEPTGNFIQNDPDEWMRAIQVNLLGTFLTMRYTLPIMVRNNYGRIINFSGGGAAYPSPHFSAYGCSKAAVVRLTETVAEEVKDYGITVNAIAPGAQNTDMLTKFIAAGGTVRTMAEMDLPVSLALFLASDEASHITGKFIHVKDKYREWEPSVMTSDYYTLRRIDPWILESLARD